MVRILHTSDWHLGATLESCGREEEHHRFLEWLVETIRDGGDDILIVSGDVFDQAQPPVEAQKAYYRFLARLRDTPLKQVVIAGGNHDSALRLDAPRELLETLSIHVVGGLWADPQTWRRALCPVRDADGHVLATVVAVPYVHECRLGVETALVDEVAIRDAFIERFTALYRQLADWADEIGAGAPIVATGHLACVGARAGDAPREIHRIGNLDGVPASIFDPRFRYVALGHLHRMFRVRDSRAWYAGTPVPLGVGESSSPRHVLRVEIADADAEPVVTPLPVPFARRVVAVTGRPEQVIATVRDLSWDTPLPPLVVAEATVDHFRVGLDGEILVAARRGGGPSPIVAAVRQTREVPAEQAQAAVVARPLRELTPEEVFRELCRVQRVTVDDEMLAAFRSLLDEEVPA